ncbi:MAG TPA: two-component sensor histidine kinase, partial [Desulfobacteraceae bacterium]|nr:two-component sensor histidine kinase [Desulfobacteraceae bacterium]
PLDPEQVYQVLLNVMINAIQAMPEGGTLTVRSRATLRGYVELDIADSGTGMSPEKAEQIFTPFFTDKNRGSGLGLAIAKNIIDKHNGRITVVSNEGQGSTFTLTFSRSLG